MISIAARVGYGTMRGLRALWVMWFVAGAGVLALEASLSLPGADLWRVAAAFVALPAAVAIHELGHAWAAVAMGLHGISMQRTTLGIHVDCPRGTGQEDATVAFGGPLLSLFGGVLLWLVSLVAPTAAPWQIAAVIVGSGCLSLLPVSGDGRTFWTWAFVATRARFAK